jgi:hypothetical protein
MAETYRFVDDEPTGYRFVDEEPGLMDKAKKVLPFLKALPGVGPFFLGDAANQAGGYVVDKASEAGLSPEVAAGLGTAANVGIQAVPMMFSAGAPRPSPSTQLSPEMSKLAKVAERQGVPLSLGQKTGSRPIQMMESVLENLPSTAGSQLAKGEAQQRAFTASALKKAGMTGSAGEAETLLAKKKELGSAIGEIAKRNNLDFNKGLTDKLAAIVDDAGQHLPPTKGMHGYTNPVADYVDMILSQVDDSGKMLGTNYQGWREPLRGLASNPVDGRYYRDIRSALDSSFRDQLKGAEAETAKKLSREYANLKVIIDSLGGHGKLPAAGQIPPSQLSAALARSVGKENKTLGVGDLNELSRVGQAFVKDKLPDSGTSQRQFYRDLMTMNLPGVLGGAGLGYYQGGTPESAVLGGAAGLGLSLGGPKAAQTLLGSPAFQRYMLTEGISPYAAALLLGGSPALSGALYREE